MNLKNQWAKACNDYLKAFCEKHDYDYEEAVRSWVGGDVGGITEVGDCFIDMRTIRTDIDMDAPEKEFIRWYDYCLRLGMIDHELPAPNFESWLKGCPRHDQAWFEEMERLHNRVEEARQLFKEALKGGSEF